jgi:hypothetical protein
MQSCIAICEAAAHFPKPLHTGHFLCEETARKKVGLRAFPGAYRESGGREVRRIAGAPRQRFPRHAGKNLNQFLGVV